MEKKPNLDFLKTLGELAAVFLIPAFILCSVLDVDPIDYALHHNDPGYYEQNKESSSNSSSSKRTASPINRDEPYSPSKDTGKSYSNSGSSPRSAHGYIKGNISANGEKIYHMPGDKYYDETVIDTSKGERWFSSPEEAEAAGWRRAYV